MTKLAKSKSGLLFSETVFLCVYKLSKGESGRGVQAVHLLHGLEHNVALGAMMVMMLMMMAMMVMIMMVMIAIMV